MSNASVRIRRLACLLVFCIVPIVERLSHIQRKAAKKVDRHHIHSHIYYNSTALDCTRKFRDFLGSARAVRRLSDRVCLENELSYIAHPKLKSKGQYKHYGQWLGGGKPLTFQERLKAQIDICLAEKPMDMDAFLRAMEAAGYEARYARGGVLSFRVLCQENFPENVIIFPYRSQENSLGLSS